ncbi:MAG: YitT family protein [Chloroflexi bacterium]|nr:MAG: YitT family protein [Chloroflexota bacterium]
MMGQKLALAVSNLNFRVVLKDYLLLTVGAIILSVNMNLFLIPADIAPGGISGMALIINRLLGWPVGLSMLLLNVPMLILGFRYLGRFRFLSRTLYVVLLHNIGVDVLAQWLPHGVTNDLLLNSLYGAVVGGIGYGLIFRGRGTSAGTGVLSRVIQLKTGVPVSQIYIATDGVIIAGLGLVFGWDKALYSLINLFVWGVVTDHVLEGPSVIRTAFIVTNHAEAVSHAIFGRMGIGVTGWEGRGMFTHAERTVLFCTISRPDVNSLKMIVAEADPHAFMVIGQGHQASGGMFRHLQTQTKN